MPILVFWFIWKSRNRSCFDNLNTSLAQVSAFSLGLLSSYPLDTATLKVRIIIEEVIDKTKPWGFFDGSASGSPQVCGAGGILFLKYDHYFTFKAGLGEGSNNFTELYALKLLLTLALDKQVSRIQVYGDSLLVINWILGKYRINNLHLAQLLCEVIRLNDFFKQADYQHIYRERNTLADKLANDGGKKQFGHWVISEYHGTRRHDTFKVF